MATNGVDVTVRGVLATGSAVAGSRPIGHVLRVHSVATRCIGAVTRPRVLSPRTAMLSAQPHRLVLNAFKLEKRLQKELMSLIKEPPPGMTVDPSSATQNLMQWVIHMDGASGTLYEGEKFELLFKFSPKYPFDSPEVTFQGQNIPVHPHVYSNGHICLSILTEDWSPALSVQSVCLSIISMLSSCKEKKRPPDNSFYIKTCNKNPKKTKWWYHDDTV